MGMTYEASRLREQGLKKCKTCKQVLPLDQFALVGNGRWPNSYCHDCKKKYDSEYRARDSEAYKASLRERYARNRSHYRDLSRRSMYNAPLGTFDLLYEQQNGKCAICGSETSARDGRSLSLDHCAETSKIRGLLCTSCNQGIGSFRHNINLLEAAINYLLRGGYSVDELRTLLGDGLSTTLSAEELGV